MPACRTLLAAVAIVIAGAIGLPVADACAQAFDPPPDGRLFLRIDTGRHTAPVRSVSVAANGIFATGSDDKTVRLWEPAKGGALARTIRLPMDGAYEGMVRAVALSPDGRRLLASGVTGPAWNAARRYSIDLFDLDSEGRDFKRLPNLPKVVNALAFDPSGETFYAGFADGLGLAQWSLAGKLLAEDKGVRASVLSVDVAPDGRVAAVAEDGTLRLYNAALGSARSAVLKAKPASLSFSPDGGLIAVGTFDAGVLVLSSDSLATVRQLKPPSGVTGDLAAVGWARMRRGVHLLAAGMVGASENNKAIVGWRDMGFGDVYVVPASRDRIVSLRPLPEGGAAFVGTGPVVGVLGADERIAFAHAGDQADFRDVFEGRFAISGDGLTIEFGTEFGGRAPRRLRLDGLGGQMEAATGDASLSPPRRQSPALPLTGWWNDPQPQLGKRALAMPAREQARSAALLADDSGFLIGTDNTLRLYDAKGDLIRDVGTPTTVWGIVVAPQAPLAVAALGDGTLRWYSLRREDALQELAAVFVHADGRRWIAWTPEGAFAQSDNGGNDLVGYARSEGERRQPDWISFAQLFHAFHKPSLVHLGITARAAALPELTRLAAAADPGKAPPPTVTLEELCFTPPPEPASRSVRRREAEPAPVSASAECLSPGEARTRSVRRADAGAGTAAAAPGVGRITLPEGVASVRLRLRVEVAPGQAPRNVEVFVNEANAGRAETRSVRRTAADQPVTRTTAEGTVIEAVREIPLSSGENRIEVRAFTDTNLYGVGRTLLEIPAPARTRGPDKPTLYVIAIGVDDYASVGIGSLKYAVADAKSFAAQIRTGAKPLYDEVVVRELYDAEAETGRIRAAFADVAAQAGEEDAVLIYVSGHGVNLRQGGRDAYAFLSHDARITAWEHDARTGGEVAGAVASAIDGDLLANELMSGIRARSTMIVLDTCHAGAFDASFDVAKAIGHSLGNARIMVAAASSLQLALDGARDENNRAVANGVFAYTALEGLAGKARQVGDPTVDASGLISYVQKRVPRNAERVMAGHAQHPFAHNVSNVPFPLSGAPENGGAHP